MIQRKETSAFGATLPEKKSAFAISVQGRRSRLSLSIFIFIIYVTIAASLKIDGTGRIKVEAGDKVEENDMLQLRASLLAGGRGDAEYAGLCKADVPKKFEFYQLLSPRDQTIYEGIRKYDELPTSDQKIYHIIALKGFGKDKRQIIISDDRLDDSLKNQLKSFKLGETSNHIIPYNQYEVFLKEQLSIFVKDSSKKNSAMQAVEEYVNEPHIAKIIRGVLEREKNDPKKREKHGILIHTTIVWNPNNLVRGPPAQYRADDPKQKFDKMLYSYQSPGYRAAVDQYTTAAERRKDKNIEKTWDFLVYFGKIPTAQPVKFEVDENGRFYVKKLKTTGNRNIEESSHKGNSDPRWIDHFLDYFY